MFSNFLKMYVTLLIRCFPICFWSCPQHLLFQLTSQYRMVVQFQILSYNVLNPQLPNILCSLIKPYWFCDLVNMFIIPPESSFPDAPSWFLSHYFFLIVPSKRFTKNFWLNTKSVLSFGTLVAIVTRYVNVNYFSWWGHGRCSRYAIFKANLRCHVPSHKSLTSSPLSLDISSRKLHIVFGNCFNSILNASF